MFDSTVLLGVVMFTITVMALVGVILFARSRLVSAGNVTILINDDPDKSVEVPAGGKLLGTLASKGIFLASACGGGGTCAQCRCRVVDGGGSRAQHPRSGLGHIETSGQIGRFSFLDGLPELSGWVPTIAIVSGPAFAGHASLAGFSDFLISTPGSSIGMGGPPMVEAALGQRLSPNDLAGAEMHELGGGIELPVESEQAATNAAKECLRFDGRRPATAAARRPRESMATK